MPNARDDWISRIKAAEREFRIAHFALDQLVKLLAREPTLLEPGFRVRDVGETMSQLEGTYLIRLFAEFEAGVRDFWKSTRDTAPRARDLIDAIGSSRHIPDSTILEVHRIRKYRNDLVHHRNTDYPSGSMIEARRSLCIYFSRLPLRW